MDEGDAQARGPVIDAETVWSRGKGTSRVGEQASDFGVGGGAEAGGLLHEVDVGGEVAEVQRRLSKANSV